MATQLEVDAVSIRFGGVTALEDVSLTLEPGCIAGLIGPNGSGKTTLFNCVCGYYRPNSGRVVWDGYEITHLRPYQVARRGIGRTFQTPNLFYELSLLANLILSAETEWLSGALGRGLFKKPPSCVDSAARQILVRLGLEEYANAAPDEMPVGLAKLGEIARALARRPRLLLLDEPAVGLNDAERLRLAELLRKLAGEGLAILIVDHNVSFITALCERITVLASGRVISSGSPTEIRTDPKVVQAYLGDDPVAAP